MPCGNSCGLAYGRAQPRWAQSGFLAAAPAGETPRNLMGFKDGTQNPTGRRRRPICPVGSTMSSGRARRGRRGCSGGSYLVARRIRISLEHWDRTEVDFQEQVIGRHKMSGAPLGKTAEFEPLDLDRSTATATRSFRRTRMCGWAPRPRQWRRRDPAPRLLL